MLQGVYIPPGTDPKTVAALERFAESLIETVADLLWDGVTERTPDIRAAQTDEARGILCEELTRFVRYGDGV